MRSRRSVWFWLQLALTLAVCAFLIVPIGLSMLAGVTQNYFLGPSQGLTLQWERHDMSRVTWNVGMAYFCTKKWMPMPAMGTSSHKASTSPRDA